MTVRCLSKSGICMAYRSVNLVSLCSQIEESLAEVLSIEEIRAKADLPEVWQSTACGVRLEPLTEKSHGLEAVALSLWHEHTIQPATLKCCLKIAMKLETHADCCLPRRYMRCLMSNEISQVK